MNHAAIDLNFSPLAARSAERPNSLRLVQEGAQVALATLPLASTTNTVTLTGLDGEKAGRVLFELESPFGTPSWDVMRTGLDFAAVWTEPGSAISPLGYRAGLKSPVVLTGHYPSGVFQRPRFVRGEAAAQPSVTAVAYQGSGRELALFSSALESGNASYVPLPQGGSGTVQDGLLVRIGSGYMLFTKLQPAAPNKSERKDGRGERTTLGVLDCLLLNAQFKPLGHLPSHPTGNVPIYEFDAEFSRDRVYLLATTEKGYIAAIATASAGTLEWAASETATPVTLASPSVAAGPDAVHAAVLDVTSQTGPLVLLGHF